mmetsp:Transcript_86239/g.158006  ORF Transcript_86239/g.158006 Transcript_86239/m.158006 type:complete len:673 (-) Transcript_86239:1144-3162(-)
MLVRLTFNLAAGDGGLAIVRTELPEAASPPNEKPLLGAPLGDPLLMEDAVELMVSSKSVSTVNPKPGPGSLAPGPRLPLGGFPGGGGGAFSMAAAEESPSGSTSEARPESMPLLPASEAGCLLFAQSRSEPCIFKRPPSPLSNSAAETRPLPVACGGAPPGGGGGAGGPSTPAVGSGFPGESGMPGNLRLLGRYSVGEGGACPIGSLRCGGFSGEAGHSPSECVGAASSSAFRRASSSALNLASSSALRFASSSAFNLASSSALRLSSSSAFCLASASALRLASSSTFRLASSSAFCLASSSTLRLASSSALRLLSSSTFRLASSSSFCLASSSAFCLASSSALCLASSSAFRLASSAAFCLASSSSFCLASSSAFFCATFSASCVSTFGRGAGSVLGVAGRAASILGGGVGSASAAGLLEALDPPPPNHRPRPPRGVVLSPSAASSAFPLPSILPMPPLRNDASARGVRLLASVRGVAPSSASASPAGAPLMAESCALSTDCVKRPAAPERRDLPAGSAAPPSVESESAKDALPALLAEECAEFGRSSIPGRRLLVAGCEDCGSFRRGAGPAAGASTLAAPASAVAASRGPLSAVVGRGGSEPPVEGLPSDVKAELRLMGRISEFPDTGRCSALFGGQAALPSSSARGVDASFSRGVRLRGVASPPMTRGV